MGAQYSLPWSTALALTRDVADPRAWSEDDLRDAEVRRLAKLLGLGEGAPRSLDLGAELTLTIAGATHSLAITDWKGAPTNRCTYDDSAAKLRLYAEPHARAGKVDQIIERVMRLEREADTATLAAAIRV